MKKEIHSSANFRATMTVLTLSVAIAFIIKKYTK